MDESRNLRSFVPSHWLGESRIIPLLCVVAALAIATILAVAYHRRRHHEGFAQPSAATARYYAAGLRNFAPGARIDAFMMSLSRGEAVCNAFNQNVRNNDCKTDINSVSSPAPASLVSVACDSFDAHTKPLNDTDSNVAVFGRVYKFSKMCLPLTFDTRSGSLVNTDETALALVLSRALFVRPTRSHMYSATHDEQYVWPTALAPVSWSVVTDANVFDNNKAKGKTLTQLLREQSTAARTARIPTTVYFLDEVEPSVASGDQRSLRVVSGEGTVTCDAKGTYALAAVVGNTQLHVRNITTDATGFTVRVKVGPRVVYEKATGIKITGDVRYAWTVLDTAVIFMFYAPSAQAATEGRVAFGSVRTNGALAGVGDALPPNTYGYIPNFYRVYQRMKEGGLHRAVTALPQRFTLRPASIDPTKCLERRSDGAVVSAACSRGNEAQAWTADDTFAVRHSGGTAGKPCMQVANTGATAYASAECTPAELLRYDQARRQLTWRDGRYCASSADGMLRVRECTSAAGVTAYDAMPFV